MHLYKYKTLNNFKYFEDIIANNRLYLPKLKELNDPLEGICNMNFGFAGCSYYFGTPVVHPHYQSALDSFRVLALTDNPNSIVMWAHYGDQFKGVCIQFKQRGALAAAKQVNYSNNLIDPLDSLKYIPMTELAQVTLMQKSKEWEYEREYRVLVNDDRQYFQLDKGDIEAVYIGFNTSTENIELVRSVCEQYEIPYYVTCMNTYAYSTQNVLLDDFKNGIWKNSNNYQKYPLK